MLGVVPTTALPCKRLTGRPGQHCSNVRSAAQSAYSWPAGTPAIYRQAVGLQAIVGTPHNRLQKKGP